MQQRIVLVLNTYIVFSYLWLSWKSPKVANSLQEEDVYSQWINQGKQRKTAKGLLEEFHASPPLLSVHQMF